MSDTSNQLLAAIGSHIQGLEQEVSRRDQTIAQLQAEIAALKAAPPVVVPPVVVPPVVEPPPAPKPVPTPPVANVLPLPAPIYAGTMAPLSAHWRVLDPDETTRYQWDFGDGTTMEGFNVAHVFKAGTYTVRLTATDKAGAVKVFQGDVFVPDDTRRKVNTLAEAARTNDSYVDLLGQTITLTAPLSITASNVLIINGTIKYTGNISRDASLFTLLGKNIVLLNVRFEPPLKTQWTFDEPGCIGGNGRNIALVDCTLLNSGHAVMSNGSASAHRMSGLLLEDCTIRESSKYSIWFEGSYLVIHGGSMSDTRLEHLIRVTDASWVNLSDITLGGYVRGSAVTLQVVANASLTNLTVQNKTVSLGPLHSKDDAITTRPSWQTDQAKTIAVRGGTYAGIVHICAAVDGVLIENIKAPQVQITVAGDSRLAFRTWKNITLNNVDAPLTGAVGKVQGLTIDGKAQ